MGSTNVDRLALETQLKKAAAERNQFVLHYQPRISLRDGRITGVEALVRWMNPERGLVPPGAVHPARRGARPDQCHRRLGAARGGSPGHAVAPGTACGSIRVAVNISAQQFYATGFLDELQRRAAARPASIPARSSWRSPRA